MWGYLGLCRKICHESSLHIMQTRDICRMPHLLSGGHWGDKNDFRGALPSHPGHDMWVLLQELGVSHIYQFLCGQSVCFAQQSHFPPSSFPSQNWNLCHYLSACFGAVIWTWLFTLLESRLAPASWWVCSPLVHLETKDSKSFKQDRAFASILVMKLV